LYTVFTAVTVRKALVISYCIVWRAAGAVEGVRGRFTVNPFTSGIYSLDIKKVLRKVEVDGGYRKSQTRDSQKVF
jgi:hypothetical protein